MSWDTYNEDVSWGILAAGVDQKRSPREKELTEFPARIANAELALVAAREELEAVLQAQMAVTEAAQVERKLITELTLRSESLLAEQERWRFCRQSIEAEHRDLASTVEDCERLLKFFTETLPFLWGSEARVRFPLLEGSDALIVERLVRRWQGVVNCLEEALANAALWRSRLLVRYEHGQGKVYREGYVISPEGLPKEPDEIIKENGKHCASRWFYSPEDLVLVWEKSSIGAPHEFTVKHTPDCLIEAQREKTRKILEKIDADWKESVGISGVCSPEVGLGWLLSDESSVAWEVGNHPRPASVAEESLSDKLDALKGRWGRT